MTQLTDEMKAQGWRDISKIETLKNYRDEYDDDEPRIQLLHHKAIPNKWKQESNLYYDSDAALFIGDQINGDTTYFRVLIPQAPNQIIIDRDDAELILCVELDTQHWKNEELQELDSLKAKLRAQLGGGDGN